MTQQDRARSTILVVDDNISNLKVATEHLRIQGADILTARDGETGIQRARLTGPDLILLDVQLPGIDGFETCRRLKAHEQTRDIPVIFMTVLTNVEDKLKGFAAGGVDYIPKPFQVEEMLARVQTHLTIYQLQRELQAEILDRKQAEAALRKANLELDRLAVLDELTQIANRRRFDQYLHAQWEQARPAELSLLLCDIDYFKQYNDGYGHQAGDSCLQRVAQGINRAVGRAEDMVARYGGEEFAVILPETDILGAMRVAEAIQAEVRRQRLAHAYSDAGTYVTLSIGAASLIPTPNLRPQALVEQADAALYAAKHQGRNRIVSSQSSVASSQSSVALR